MEFYVGRRLVKSGKENDEGTRSGDSGEYA